ncbi:PREDICTED: receptor-like serine/threonine-protein kinase SD1-7 [Ipomoea nil]|uniref:receptor-like serine/threonine-protein kinase SD1-7 n=1 Tax=Ipomoea nil TaxID=35883 RepID=UPI0009016F17|nr:PREDICTED: receptor-like serine/threonine-protein kinase SD1-7 [Ipomoea nil]
MAAVPFCVFFCNVGGGTDSLRPGESVTRNRTLVSADGNFSLGFFHPGNSSSSFLGIWYNSINKTVIWVANRESPLRQDSEAVFTLGYDGNLQLLDGGGRNIIWSTNISGGGGGSTAAQLQDRGDLVVKQGESTVWESFDGDSDTLMPEMRLKVNKKTGKRNVIRCWSSSDDPRPGKFSCGIDPKGPPQMFIWKENIPYQRTNLYQEGFTYNVYFPSGGNAYFSFYSYAKENDELYYSYGYANTLIPVRSVLTPEGLIQFLLRQKTSDEWSKCRGAYFFTSFYDVNADGNDNSPHKNKCRLVAIIVASVSAFFLISVLVYILTWKYCGRKGWVSKRATVSTAPLLGKDHIELLQLSLRRIIDATNNFHEANKLGEGGFGLVYKGFFPKFGMVAIKRLSKQSSQGLNEFMNELKLIAKLQHTNLVRLLGCCIEDEEKILIYEYLSKRSLDKFLFDAIQKDNLDWNTRIEIIEGVAQGILYLHKYSRLKVIYRDLKASNILLDEAMKPKISDFGMARIFGVDQTQAKTNHVVGTYGYIPPEYVLHGQFSEKSDIFSFGVLLLEIVSGQKNSNFFRTQLSLTLLGWAWKNWKDGQPLEFVDLAIKESCDSLKVIRCIEVGLLCVQAIPTDRPIMSDVVQMLSNDHAAPIPQLKEPAFVSSQSNPIVCISHPNSKNEITISSILDPR